MGVESDRELLELAAKAAGRPIHDWNGGWPVEYVEHWSGSPNEPPEQEVVYWNPLEDDGDALRLAVTLGLTVECDFHDSDTCAAYQTRGEIVADEQSGMLGEVIGSPEFAATRRAIVRAAAEIGRAMP
ncbi:hypothetical protein [Stutzerimonas nitrititolerans]|uniref:Phage ABA sandwich domain-containing protein n=1 Tax=Stutzerimonas nitrititolerans TaxID=2482751 RepID=A0ABX9UWE6_9GAMM|nr:hypothetical protein [Stutzerimonas nitrititolerans]RMH97301.1 hypothetical protein EA795_19160 [Stutzerimonas nitrititolerans]